MRRIVEAFISSLLLYLFLKPFIPIHSYFLSLTQSWDEPQPEPQLAFSSSSYSTQPLPNEASSSKDTLSPLKRKREEGEGIDQSEPENKMAKPMEPLLQNGGE